MKHLSVLLGSRSCWLYYSVAGKVNRGEQLLYLLTNFYSICSFCVLNVALICCLGDSERSSPMVIR